jgi:hypothetical protein
MNRFTCLASLLLIACAPMQGSVPQSGGPAATAFDAAERRTTIEQLADALTAMYLDPATGVRYASTLRAHLRQGRYDPLADPRAFADKVKADLQAVHPDAHLRLLPNEVFEHGPEPEAADDAGLPEGIEEMRMIGQVAYLRFTAFPHDPRTAPAARAFLLENAGSTKAVIIDARPLPGGGIEVMDAMLPLFFSERTILARLETRASGDRESPFPDGPTLIRTTGRAGYITRDHIVMPDLSETRLRGARLFYLTSASTASAGEHLAMVLKRTKRATLIGEKTRGAGHYVTLAPVGSRLTALVPVGRAFDPDTGLDWEGVGVTPDISVPADAALDEALKRSR